ncbi:MAG: DNA polymerase IV [Deltaproteobacteria bacterium]|nr:DNA polymerase IV [Deltaproteobacteria bacterium]
MGWARATMHVDMDAFYASVEQHDHPELLGRAVIVGGAGRRAVVCAASYEARRFGVKSAMPMYAAERLCPHAVVLPVRMGRYLEVSKRLMTLFGRFGPTVEPLSVDEAFLDVTGTEGLFGPPAELAWKVQRAVREELGLSCSVGVAASKYVAKVASDLKKPGGLVVVPPGEERAFLEPLDVERLWGVGPKAAEQLRAAGYATIGDVARVERAALEQRFGALGAHIAALARGEDERPVEDGHERKSLGAERTLEHDIRGPERVLRELLPLCDEVAAGLRAKRLRAGSVRLKLKYADFKSVTREARLEEPVQDAASLRAALERLVKKADTTRPMRLVGVTASALVDEDAPRQQGLFSQPVRTKDEQLERTVDKIRDRFGDEAVVRGTLVDEASAPARPRGR